jgi:hypothetical protein
MRPPRPNDVLVPLGLRVRVLSAKQCYEFKPLFPDRLPQGSFPIPITLSEDSKRFVSELIQVPACLPHLVSSLQWVNREP